MEGGTVTNRYQGGRPYQKNHVKRVRRRLPNSTRIDARGAKPIGDFGLVYQRLPYSRSEFEPVWVMLYQSLPPRRNITHT